MVVQEQIAGRSFSGVDNGPKASLLYGAQNGFAPILGGKALNGETIEEWASNSAYVTSDLIVIPLSTPAFFKEFGKDQEKYLRRTWVEVMSTLPTTIEGLTSTLTVENDTVSYGASGNLVMKEHTKITKAESNIVNNYVERQGLPINEFLEFLIRYGVGNEYTQTPQIASVQGVRKKFKGKTRLQSYYTGSAMYVELDAMKVNVVKAYYAVAMRPQTGGEIVSKRDQASAKEITRYSVPIDAMTDSNDAIKAFAQLLVDKMSIFNVNASISTIMPVGKTEVDLHTSDVNSLVTDHGGINVNGFESDEQLPADKIADAYKTK